MTQLKKDRLFVLREELLSKLADCNEKADIKLLSSNNDFIIRKFSEYCGMVDSFKFVIFRLNTFIDFNLSEKSNILTKLDQVNLHEIRDELLERYSYSFDSYSKMDNSTSYYEYDNEEIGTIKGRYLAYQEILRLFDSLLPIKNSER